MKPFHLTVASLLILVLPSSLFAKDLGGRWGEPTLAFAMYSAQTIFAVEKCVSEGLTADAEGAASFLKRFNQGASARRYKAADEDFATKYDAIFARYVAAWDAANSEQHRQFCDGLNSEIAFKNENYKGLKQAHWIRGVDYFRGKFSPITKESLEQREKMQKVVAVLSIVGAAASTAASVSAGHDAVSSARAGDWTTSNQQMDMSRSFRQVGGGMALSQTSSEGIEGQTTSVLEVKMADGTLRIIRCPVVDHFFGYAAPVESPIWITYQKIWMACRDAISSDFQAVE